MAIKTSTEKDPPDTTDQIHSLTLIYYNYYSLKLQQSQFLNVVSPWANETPPFLAQFILFRQKTGPIYVYI